MSRKWFFILLAVWFVFCTVPVQAGPVKQVYYLTPTPGADGRIVYIVKANDTCLGISLLNNIPLEQLRALNNINPECTNLQVGQELVLGFLPTATPISGPTPTPTSILPTPTPFNGTGFICIYLYEDINGNAKIEPGEEPLAGGAISMSNRGNTISRTGQTTADGKAVCFEDLPEGEYTVSMGIPIGYNATRRTTYTINLRAGDQSTLDFGAQRSALTNPALPEDESTRRSPVLAVLGGLVILGGIGIGIYAARMSRR
jgi:hypothetical protein